MNIPRLKSILSLILLFLLITACATSPTGRKQLMLVSPQSAIAESEKAYLSTVSELEKDEKLVKDPKVIERVATITGRVVTAAVNTYPNSAQWKWSVAIIDDPETVNAWCMAGGRMAIYTGLFDKLNLTDDEFAQIMGHEISHALANHSAERMSVAMAKNASILAVGVASENSGLTMTGTALAAKLALELPNSRTAEAEADKIGIKLASLAGYKPEAAVTLWQKMNNLGGKLPPEFLSTHPAPENRQGKLSAMVDSMRMLNPKGTLLPVHKVEIVK